MRQKNSEFQASLSYIARGPVSNIPTFLQRKKAHTAPGVLILAVQQQGCGPWANHYLIPRLSFLFCKMAENSVRGGVGNEDCGWPQQGLWGVSREGFVTVAPLRRHKRPLSVCARGLKTSCPLQGCYELNENL
jgi:hypothetical protein